MVDIDVECIFMYCYVRLRNYNEMQKVQSFIYCINSIVTTTVRKELGK